MNALEHGGCQLNRRPSGLAVQNVPLKRIAVDRVMCAIRR